MTTDAQRAQAAASGPRSLEDLLEPMSPAQFMADHWLRSAIHLPGTAGRFDPILTWDDLASTLDTCTPDPQRFRVMRQGKRLADDLYLTAARLIDAGALAALLDRGATLVIDSFDKTHRQAGRLADAVARDLAAEAWVNLYATWGSEKGLTLHADCHEVLVLQTAGRKRWTVYAPTRPDPNFGDPFEPPADAAEPAWSGTLEDGDLLYIPRGWPHVAEAVDGPSLHLTIGLSRPTGSAFLRWLADALDEVPTTRAYLPPGHATGELDSWVATMRQSIDRALTPQSVAEFHDRQAARQWARPRFALPGFGKLAPNDWTADTELILASSQRLDIRTAANGTLLVGAAGRDLPCPPLLAGALKRLSSDRAIALGALERDVGPDAIQDLRRTLAMLMQLGLLTCAASSENATND